MIRRTTLLLSALLGACAETRAPQGQVLLFIDTDAWLPPGVDDVRTPDDPHPLFDTLRVEVYPPRATTPCAKCVRTFTLDAASFRQIRTSVGVSMTPGASGYRVRVRLFSSAAVVTGDPPAPNADGTPPSSVIDVIAGLPSVEEEGIIERSLFLKTESVGLPVGTLDAPVPTTVGRPTTSLVRTWPGARHHPCVGDPQDGEVCIPGQAFWMGNAKVPGEFAIDGATHLRLVVLSPFFLDSTEVTVRALRKAKMRPEVVWSGNTTGSDLPDFCTFTTAPGGNEVLPVNCMSWGASRAYCQSRGADLPTEAQIELVSSAFNGSLFVWGEDAPATAPIGCDDAVLQRAGWGQLVDYPAECRPETPPGGPLAVGALTQPARRDRLVLADGGVVWDLVGNLNERALDVWNSEDEPCWSHGGVYTDPLCDGVSKFHSTRGGSWVDNAQLAMAATRRPGNDPAGISGTMVNVPYDAGFRCARPGVP